MMIRRANGKIESYTKESGEEAVNIRTGEENLDSQDLIEEEKVEEAESESK